MNEELANAIRNKCQELLVLGRKIEDDDNEQARILKESIIAATSAWSHHCFRAARHQLTLDQFKLDDDAA